MKIDSATIKYKVICHFQNLLGHQRQGLFNGYNKASLRQRFLLVMVSFVKETDHGEIAHFGIYCSPLLHQSRYPSQG